jgi:hypothetical protein
MLVPGMVEHLHAEREVVFRERPGLLKKSGHDALFGEITSHRAVMKIYAEVASKRAAPPGIEPWAHGGNDMS